VDQRLQPALHVHGSRGRIDPAESYEDQRGQQPEEHHADAEPSQRKEKKFPGEEIVLSESAPAKGG
jgi:hypothetical protein